MTINCSTYRIVLLFSKTNAIVTTTVPCIINYCYYYQNDLGLYKEIEESALFILNIFSITYESNILHMLTVIIVVNNLVAVLICTNC